MNALLTDAPVNSYLEAVYSTRHVSPGLKWIYKYIIVIWNYQTKTELTIWRISHWFSFISGGELLVKLRFVKLNVRFVSRNGETR